ncbi:hypothetical protein JCM19274_1832 [Algibacter lectus]|uniref:Uncharacterized protein n=1 Tax=Algibacter lectus TaxID=221126 RepID=A0A090WV96_9FLAO|nr:hypothetical protein [Algibacter lectus]GAL79324.1 hypothetical protein JCM19274_1832 [Algibacter lectus]
MKKLSDFKENKVELNDVNGGRSFPSMSLSAINEYPGGASTPGNYIATIGTDINGNWVWTDYGPNDFCSSS